MGVVFDHGDAVASRDRQDRVHLAPHAARNARARSPRVRGVIRLASCRLVEVERVGPDVGEDRLRAAQHERVDRRDERERRDDHLVARADVQQQGRHLQGVRAGGGRSTFGTPSCSLQQAVALLGEGAISGDVPSGDRLEDVLDLFSPAFRLIEGDHRFAGWWRTMPRSLACFADLAKRRAKNRWTFLGDRAAVSDA